MDDRDGLLSNVLAPVTSTLHLNKPQMLRQVQRPIPP